MLKKNMNMSMNRVGSIHFRMEEDDWLSAVRDCFNNHSAELGDELEQILLSRPTICKVPRDRAAANPAAFTPQCVSLGPYHHGRADLYAMERYKLATALRFYTELGKGDLTLEESAIHNMKKRERCIRNCYDTFIDCRAETLAWLVTIDAIFLLDCLQLRDGCAADFNCLRKDMMKLENQIPLFALENILRLQLGEKAPCKLADLLLKTLTPLSPIATGSIDAAAKRELPARAHLLDALYFMLVPSLSPISRPEELIQPEDPVPSVEEEQQEEQEMYKEEVRQGLSLLWKLLSSLKAERVKRAVDRLTKVSSSLLKIVASLGSLRILRTFAGYSTTTTADAEDTEEDNMSVAIKIPPRRDELAVPSVAELKKAGVRFSVAAKGGVRSVCFDAKSRTLYLPAMRVTAQTETVLRNLIAYEASLVPCSSHGAMEFTRFMDFVNGIVDSVEDVQILKQCGVLRHHLQSDLEVANLFNGMGACVKLPRLDYLNAVVRDVNAFYRRTWKVKVAYTVNTYVFGSWKIMSFLAALIMLALTCLQAYCSIYACRKWLDPSALE